MTSKTILVVEDDRDLLQLILEKLRHAGYTTLSAADGQEGLTIALEKHPDLILLDVIMPRLDGIGMLKQLRQDAWGLGAQVMMLTNSQDVNHMADATGLGAHDYLIKSDWLTQDIIGKVAERLR